MEDEMLALEQNRTWDLVFLLPGKSTIGCSWIFTVKCLPMGLLKG